MGQGCVFTTKPIRNEHFGIWEGTITSCVSMLVVMMVSEGFLMPDIKWKDDAVELRISLEYGGLAGKRCEGGEGH